MEDLIPTGEPDVKRDIVVIDSAGVMTTTFKHTSAFASKVQAHWRRNPIDFDGDGNYELLASFQANRDSITTTNITWNASTSAWDTVVTKVVNPKSWAAMRIEFGGVGTGIETHDITFVTPDDYSLEQNYPNPFNPSTTIRFNLPISKQVTVRVYNLMGQVVKTLVDNEMRSAGSHSVVWDGTNEAGHKVASGQYVYRLRLNGQVKSKIMTLLK
jgi:hypothetical protein